MFQHCPQTTNLLICAWLYSFWVWDESYSLPPLGADTTTVTVSGFSSGAHFAHHLNVIYSDFIKGAGLVSGFPYGFDSPIGSMTVEERAQKSILKAE